MNENVWYQLTVPKDADGIIVQTCKLALEFEHPLADYLKMIKNVGERLKIPEWTGVFGEDHIGYGASLDLVPGNDEFISYQANAPEGSWGDCPICDGSGQAFDRTCDMCDGFGEAYLSDWEKAYQVCASLGILFWWLDAYAPKQKSPMEVRTHVGREKHGGELSATLRQDIAKWLIEVSPCDYPYVRSTMSSAWQVMMWYRPYHEGYLRAFAHVNGRLTLDVPGDRTGLYTQGDLRSEVRMHSHNVDSPFQQLVLLIGLAKIQDEYRAGLETKLEKQDENDAGETTEGENHEDSGN